jgi:hypothetical protein
MTDMKGPAANDLSGPCPFIVILGKITTAVIATSQGSGIEPEENTQSHL